MAESGALLAPLDKREADTLPSSGRGGAAGRLLILGMGVSVFGALALLMVAGRVERSYVLPGALAIVAVVAAPLVVWMRRRACDVFNPVILAGWSYFFPAFALSGVLLAGAAEGPPFARVLDPVRDIPRAQLYIVLGYLGLLAGFVIPGGRRIGLALGRRLPAFDWAPTTLIVPALLLLGVGLAIRFRAFAMGLIGFQFAAPGGRFDALVLFLGMTTTMALVLLWSSIFRADSLTRAHRLAIALLIALVPLMTVMSGSRAAPVMMAIPMGVAYWYSRSVVRLAAIMAFGVIVVASLGLGMLYGTTFRLIKGETQLERTGSLMIADEGSALSPSPPPAAAPPTSAAAPPAPAAAPPASATLAAAPADAAVAAAPAPSVNATVAESRVSMTDQFTQAALATATIGDRGWRANMALVLRTAGERLEITSSLAVIAGKYRALAQRERELGLDGNIWTALSTAFIPRALWPEKPIVAFPRAYGELYFDVSHSTPALTPMGDLLRNFGPIGVPVGMFVIGFVLRLLYASLIEGGASPGRVAAYYLVVSHVSYESLYGPILPGMLRTAFVAALSLGFISLMIRLMARGRRLLAR